MVDLVFLGVGASQKAAILETYSRPPPVQEDPMNDEEMMELFEEMAVADQVNTSDVKGWRGDVKKKASAVLNRKRMDARRNKLKEQKAKVQRRKTAKQAKALAFVKRKGKGRGKCKGRSLSGNRSRT